jgi:outer membrane protein assembly factor BamD
MKERFSNGVGTMRHVSLLALTGLVLLTACASDKDAAPKEEAVDVLYNRAAKALDEGNYKEATKNFEEVERQHPYSQWATQAQLMAAYSSYQGQNYDEAELALDRFIELHPGSKDVDYAYYLKALCYYEQISDVRRDQEMTQSAVEAFTALQNRFPESRYARDAALKLDLTYDHLAGKEMEIGRYYLTRGQTQAAINRFRTVIQKYQTTTHTAEALHRLVEAYLTLGMTAEATKVASVLGYNYPGSEWYKRSYELLDPRERQKIMDDRGLIDKTVDSLFKPD